MKRRIINIDEEKCNGCGACAKACHEGAIEMVNSKAHLTREDYCDGTRRLPARPARLTRLSFEEREAPAYKRSGCTRGKKSVKLRNKRLTGRPAILCPAAVRVRAISESIHHAECDCKNTEAPTAKLTSQLSQWPVQIKLAPVNAPYFEGARLLIAADCTAYAYANFHNEFIRGRITLVGCPKLDNVDYSEKLADILAHNEIKDILVVRMEVPCCGGIVNAVKLAMQKSGKLIPWRVLIVTTDGNIVE